MTDQPFDRSAIVTGVPGWLGTRFVQCLQQGMPDVDQLAKPEKRNTRVLINDVLSDQDSVVHSNGSLISSVKGNLTRQESLRPLFEGAEGGTLFHLAGVIHPQKGTQEFYDVNLSGTESLLKLATEFGLRRVVYMSSNSPMGTNADKHERFDETSPYHPYMHYGKSKMLAEQAVIKAGSDRGIETVIIRSPWFYGPRQPARQNLFFSMIKNGKVPLVGDGLNKRSMAYIDNICQGLLLAERCDRAKGEIYWIADRDPYTMNEIIDTIEELLEKEFHMQVAHKRVRLPSLASEVAYGFDLLLQSAGLYHQKIHVLSEMNKTIACSTAKAERELDYDPKISLKEGMRRSIQWVLDQGAVI